MSSQDQREEYDYVWKVIVKGPHKVGKSNLTRRMNSEDFQEQHAINLAADFKVRTVEVNGKRVRTMIWDLPGLETFRAIIQSYYRRAVGMMLVYDVSSRETFRDLDWIWPELRDHYLDDSISVMVVGNKTDLKQRAVSEDEGKAFAEKFGHLFMETSAKDNINVQEAFQTLLQRIYKVQVEGKLPSNTVEGKIKLKATTASKQKTKCW